MNATAKIGLFATLALVVIGASTGLYLWNKPHQDLSAAPADFVVAPADIFQAYVEDEATANQTYLNKVVEMTGTIVDKMNNDNGSQIVVLEVPGEIFGINCAFEPDDIETLATLTVGQSMTLRGYVTGYTADVNLARCIVLP